MQKEIERIDKRLAELRVEYVNASYNRRKFIEVAAKLFIDKRSQLVLRLENSL